MENLEKIFRGNGVFKHYDWGGKTFLTALIQHKEADGKPYAEYWLGSDLHENFGKLPYLFKVLDVEKMLSIQVHPTKTKAQIKFAEENKKGIPRDAPHRNYKDDNHKPELLSPLSEFYLLHGFKPAAALEKILHDVPELRFLQEDFKGQDYKKLYTRVMTMPQEEVNERLQPLLDRIIPLYKEGKLNKTDENFWAARAALTFNTGNNTDRGIFSIYLFNVVKMKEGEALFQDAGMPHAYLEGYTMEIMANSDNVLRGGLTPKHIDVPELLENTVFAPTVPNVIEGEKAATGEVVFPTPADDFQMSRIVLRKEEGVSLPAITTDIYFVYKGEGTVSADDQHLHFSSGDALLVQQGAVAHFGTESEAVIYRATVPVKEI